VIQLLCTYDPATKGGNAADGRKVKGTIHWVNAKECTDAKVMLYDRLFKDEDPEENKKDFIDNLNPESLQELESCKLEKSLSSAEPEKVYQFERVGYFCRDNKDSKIKNTAKSSPVFNRTVTMRDAWAKMSKKKA